MKRRAKPPIEYSLLVTAVLCLMAIGVVMVYSASSATSLFENNGDSSYYLKREIVFAVLGLLALRFMSRRGLAVARKIAPVLLVGSLFLLLLLLVPGLGRSANGAQRWLGAGPLQVQPSEIAKLALVLYAAQLIAMRPQRVLNLRELAKPLLIVVAVACLLILQQPDLGTALVIVMAICAMLVAAGANARDLALLGAAVGFVAVIAILIEPYRRDRLLAFLHPAADATGSGYQSLQGMIALGSGGIFGVGLGESVQKIFYLPEAHTDMILAVIGEELGLLGVGAVLSLYGIIAYAGFRTAKAARDLYTKLLATGITSLILTQAILNIGAVMGLAPLTGVPLPLVSYGGSSLVVLLAAMGLLLNAAAGGRAARSVSGTRRRAKPNKVVPIWTRHGSGNGAATKRTGHGRTAPKRIAQKKSAKSGNRGGGHGGARRAGARRRGRAAG